LYQSGFIYLLVSGGSARVDPNLGAAPTFDILFGGQGLTYLGFGRGVTLTFRVRRGLLFGKGGTGKRAKAKQILGFWGSICLIFVFAKNWGQLAFALEKSWVLGILFFFIGPNQKQRRFFFTFWAY